MRVLFCTLDYPPVPAGGAEKQAQLQAEALVLLGHRIDVVCPRTGKLGSGTLNGVRVYRLPRIGKGAMATLSYLFAFFAFLVLRVRAYDMVHVHLANLQADVAVAVARLFRRPSYVKLAAGGPLGEIERLRTVAVVTRNYGIRHATLVQAISTEIESDLQEIGVPQERIRSIPNGVSIPAARATRLKRDAARRSLDLPPEYFIALYIGRMERDKGVLDLLDAWRGMDTSRRLLVLLGSPGLKHPMAITHLPQGVMHRTWFKDVTQYLLATDILVVPSHGEGMSNVLLEAMAQGVATIATAVGAAGEMVTDGDSGLLVNPHDIDALHAAIERLAEDSGLRQRMGVSARDSVLRYDIQVIARQIDASYRSISDFR